MLTTSEDVLCSDKGSNLEKMFSGKHELKMVDNKVFLDRDGHTFTTLVNFLRNGQELVPQFDNRNHEVMFYKELEFWEIGPKYKQKTPAKKNTYKMDDEYVSPYSLT
jgi:hypothetical protein